MGVLTEETKTDKMEVLEDGRLQVRRARIIYDDGVEISRSFHREVLDPATDRDKLATRDQLVRDVAATVWTPEVIAARERTLEEDNARIERERIERERGTT